MRAKQIAVNGAFAFALLASADGVCGSGYDALRATAPHVSGTGSASVMPGELGLAALAAGPAAPLAALGKKLFFDKRLSADGTVSCATCHVPDRAFSDGKQVSEGIGGQKGTRNAPSLLNATVHKELSWDGRRDRLEQQVLDPLFNSREHALRDVEHLRTLVSLDAARGAEFKALFPEEGINDRTVGIALASFVRSLDPGPSRFDDYLQHRHETLLTDSERRGLALFLGRGGCASCHTVQSQRPTFSDDGFHALPVGKDTSVGSLDASVARSLTASAVARQELIGADPRIAALGRFNVTERLPDIGKYRTPSLRNVALTSPYMHDGSVPTLEDAVELEIYYRSSTNARPLIMTMQEKRDLVAFLKTLTAESLERKSKEQ